MDKNLDFEKLVEQARFLSRLMNGGVNNSEGIHADETGGQADSAGDSADYAGAFSSGGSEIPAPDTTDNQDAIEKAIQAVKIFQSMSQSGQTSDNAAAYDNTSADDKFTSDDLEEDNASGESDKRIEDSDFSRFYDETFTTPSIKAIKSAVRFVDPKYHKAIGLWIKFLEMQNMTRFYAKRAAEGRSRPEYADWRSGMLMSVRPHVSYEKQCTIDMLIKVMELKEIIFAMEDMNNGR
ncbi:MAG: hypothetical protein LBB94_01480 [Clostridiales bacterium]|jgi:hypothetical protein|nr:hypothetical protein [Clostridiales bacterium]